MLSRTLCIFWLFLLFSAFVVYGYTVDLEYGWDREDLRVRSQQGYDYLGVKGSIHPNSTLGEVFDVKVIPRGYKVDSYEVLWEEWEEIGSGYRVGVISEGVAEAMMVEDAGGFQHAVAGDLLGYGVMTSVVKPFRYQEGRVSMLKRMGVRVSCSPDAGALSVGRRSEILDRHLRDLVADVAGTEVAGYGDWLVEGYKEWVSDGPTMNGGVVDCIIVTDDAMVSEFETLAAWHDRLGMRTVVRSVSWIESKYPGGDSAERVRNFLKDAYQNWGTVYVLMGGTPDVVPMRYAWTDHYGGAMIPTDLYYANLDGTWNANGNDIFGEFTDGVTFYPQVLPGRAPVKTAAEAQIFVDKTISYVTEPDSDFVTTASFLGEVIFPDDWVPGEHIFLDGGLICDSAAAYLPAYYDTLKLYQRDGMMTRTTCIQSMDEGYAFSVIAGHGDAFRTSAADGEPPFIANADFDTLDNDKRFGFIYALNCNNSAIDVDCVFRHFMINPIGGGFATYATTRYDFPNVGQFMLNDFMHFIFERGVTRLGDVCGTHHASFVPSAMVHDGAVRWTLYTYLLMGDPVVRLWTSVPDTLEVTSAPQMALTDSVYSVEVRDDGIVLAGAVVTLIGDRGEYGVGMTGDDGVALVNYRPRGLGWADVVVSNEGFFMYEDSVEVTGAEGRLYVSGVSVDDGGAWTGNNDGTVGWGERVGLGVSLVNGGVGTLHDVSCSLRVVDGCSLTVSVKIDSIVSDSLVHVGSGCEHPGSMPFGLNLGDEVLGRCGGWISEELGCWIWLDAMGWHVRFMGDGGTHSYVCSMEVHGEMLGYSVRYVEPEDSVLYAGGLLVFGGDLGPGDVEDGLDLVLGMDGSVVVHDGQASYGTVGSSEVVGWYDVEYLSSGVGDGLGVWYELSIADGGSGSWVDWFQVAVLDGDLFGERIEFVSLGGDTTGVIYGLRNAGGGALSGVEGRLRGLSGVEVTDSVSSYGEICAGCYSDGDYYRARELGGPVSYEVFIQDAYGREWRDTIDVRVVEPVSGLAGRVGADNIALSWTPSSDSLLLGYDIYRADIQGGLYEMAGLVDGSALYVDGGLASEEDYYYYVCARDSMGNLSAPSETAEVWTGAPSMPGWPAGTQNAVPSAVTLSDLDGDGDLELVMGSKDQHVYLWDHEGVLQGGWPLPVGAEVWSGAATVNIDGDPELEIIIGTNGGDIFAWNLDGSGVRYEDGLFKTVGGQIRGGPAVDDIDNDMDFEIVVGNTYGQIYVMNHDGSGYLQGNGFFAQGSGCVYGSPALADLDNDGDLEIIAAMMGGDIYAWHHDGTGFLDSNGLFSSPGAVYGSVAVGDVDGNGDPEIVCGTTFGRAVKVYDDDGSMHVGWPRGLDGDVYASPALADLDFDDRLDIVIGSHRGDTGDSASVYVFDDMGIIRPGWPLTFSGDFFASPVVGDISGDGLPDIVIVSNNGYVYAWHDDGSPVNGWPRHMGYEFYATPGLGDLDNDGDVELVAAGYDALVHVFDCSTPYSSSTMEWPKMNNDLYNSGLYGGPSKAGVDPGDEELLPVRVSLAGYPNPAVSTVGIRLGVPSTQANEAFSVDVFDVRGRHLRQLHSGELEPGFHEFHWNGMNKSDAEVSSGIYFVKVSWKRDSLSRKVVMVR